MKTDAIKAEIDLHKMFFFVSLAIIAFMGGWYLTSPTMSMLDISVAIVVALIATIFAISRWKKIYSLFEELKIASN